MTDKSFAEYKRENAALLGAEDQWSQRFRTKLNREETARRDEAHRAAVAARRREVEREVERIKNRVRLEKPEKALTVGQLRKWLAQYPDDLPVWYSGPNWQEESAAMPIQYGDVARRDGYPNPSYYEHQDIPERVEISVY